MTFIMLYNSNRIVYESVCVCVCVCVCTASGAELAEKKEEDLLFLRYVGS